MFESYALHLHEPRCLQLCLWVVLWIPFAGLFGISSSAKLSSYSSNCFNYIDVKSSSGLDRLGGGLVIRRVGNGSEFCLCTYNYQFPSERNFLQGPWIGFKTPEKAVGSYGWVGVIITRIRRRIIGCLLIDLLAPSGALVVIMVYYIHINPVFQIFQILQILK